MVVCGDERTEKAAWFERGTHLLNVIERVLHVEEEGIGILINMASNERDIEVKKQAIFWLGQKAGERSLKVLGDTVNSNDADTEIQKQAVFAISQRSKDESVPLLINIAKTHAKAEVRKQAIFWLGQTGDERAVTFFKEILSR